jgi:hypothetical protein
LALVQTPHRSAKRARQRSDAVDSGAARRIRERHAGIERADRITKGLKIHL